MKNFFFIFLLSFLNLPAKAIPISYKEMSKDAAKIYLYGDYHKEALDQLNEFHVSKTVLFKKLNEFSKEPTKQAFILWEISSLFLSSSQILEQYKNLFIVEQAFQIERIIEQKNFTHMKFVPCDDVRYGTYLMRPVLKSFLNYIDGMPAVQAMQQLRTALSEEKVKALKNHIQLQDSSLLRSLPKVSSSIDMRKLMGYVQTYLEGTRDFIRWLYLFSDFERNKSQIENSFEKQAYFAVLFPPNLEAVMNILTNLEGQRNFLLYFGKNHIQNNSRYPSISAMLKDFGFALDKEEETRLLGSPQTTSSPFVRDF